jgi:hypothetical protein
VLGSFMDDELFADIHDHMMNALSESAGWLQQAENYYTQQRNRVMGSL